MMKAETKVVRVIQKEMARRTGRSEGENFLVAVEALLGGQEHAKPFWSDLAEAIGKALAPKSPQKPKRGDAAKARAVGRAKLRAAGKRAKR